MVNVAGIGLGNQGGSDIQNIATPDVPIQRQGGLPGLKFYPYPGITPPRPTGGRRSDNPNQMGDALDNNCEINSRYGGVQIGAITYSFRSIREVEYKIAPWSNAVKEVKVCREFCRQILL